jgi:formylglycine-generating enzyme required for sulfatase activity
MPLALGGMAADIPLPGVARAEASAHIGVADGRLFVKPVESGEPLTCNGARLTASRWLEAGDVLGVGTTRVEVRVDGDTVQLVVHRTVAEEITEPPILVAAAPPETDSAPAPHESATITALPFQPRAGTTPTRRRRWRPRTLLIWVPLALLAAAAWFVFTARSIELIIEPAPDRVELHGTVPAPQIGGRRLMRAGHYTLVAEKDGFRRLEEEFDVTRSSESTLRFTLERLPGFLVLDVGTVMEVAVVVDGEEIGVTPVDPIELAPGTHRLELTAARYRDLATTVEIEGRGIEQTLAVELEPRYAAITFVSDPAGAQLLVDGRGVGFTPVTAELLEGRRAYELKLQGHKPARGAVTVAASEPQRLPPVVLQLLDARLGLRSVPDDATVTVDDEYRGLTPLELYLSPGAHEIELTRAGYEPATSRVELRSGESRDLELALAARIGELRVAVLPVDALLYVNGERQQEANTTLRLPAVPHEIALRREGYEEFRQTLTPRPGFPQSLSVELRTPEEVVAASRPEVIRIANDHELHLIEGGPMRMGASRREPGRRANETLREVELTRPYYLATQEVSNKQFRKFAAGHLSGTVGAYSLEADHHPAVRVTWDDAARYCNWLSRQEGRPEAYLERGGRMVPVMPVTTGYRLPSEAEWAWAARYDGGEGPRKYPWGNELPVQKGSGNYADRASEALLADALDEYDDGFIVTAPVDSFDPDVEGLHNLGGNVAEWVHDYYTIFPPGTKEPARDPLGPAEGEYHVIRGASWMHSSVTELRLTFRDYGKDPRPDVGFRIARFAE